MVMGRNPNGRLDGLLRGALDSGWLVLARLPASLRAHLHPCSRPGSSTGWQR